jgi:hypothetical protein
MEHLSGPVDADGQARRATESPRNKPQDIVRSLSQSRSSAGMPASESRPHALHRQSLDHLTTPIFERNPQDFTRSLYRPQSSDGLASRFIQPERRSVHKSRSLDKIDPNTTPERRQTNPPLSLRRSSLNITGDIYSTQSPERTPVPENKPLKAHTFEMWTPSSARIGDTIQSLDNSASSPYERPQSIYRGRISDLHLRGADDIGEITSVEPSTSNRLETLSRYDGMGEQVRNQTNDQDAFFSTLGIPKEYGSIIWDVVKHGGNEQELLRRLEEERNRISQVDSRDVETLIKALGIRDDDLDSSDYLEARQHAQTIVRVIRTDGQNKEFNDASKALLELAPARSRLRSLVNPTKDVIDWYDASWRNQHAMSKLDTTRWGDSIRKVFYQVNQPFAGITNTRSGNLGFIGLQAAVATAYTWYIEKKFPLPTLGVNLENSAIARQVYTKLPTPINQLFDTIQFQGFGISLEAVKEFLTRNVTTGG